LAQIDVTVLMIKRMGYRVERVAAQAYLIWPSED
jgi:hypothetical protein